MVTINDEKNTAWSHPRGAAIVASYIEQGITADECYDFQSIYEFLRENPTYVTKARGKKRTPNILMDSGVLEVAERWYKARKQKVIISSTKTLPDPAVSLILTTRGLSKLQAANAIVGHYDAMAAENVIGTLLEMYIAEHMEHYGWIWCAGEIIKSVDFLKKTDDGFIPLQVKNRSNSENSSSSAIRNGTDIIKWHRINAYTGSTYWDKFPEPELRDVLTEEGFHKYISENLA